MRLTKYTRAQLSLRAAFPAIIKQVGRLWTLEDHTQLVKILQHLKNESPWGYAIRGHFEKNCLIERTDHTQLLKELSSAAVDDPGVMSKIVGWEATLLLLQYFNQSH